MTALAWLLAAAASARADLIQWSYSWSNNPTTISADSPGNGSITLTDESTRSVAGDTDIVATNINVHSTAPKSNPDIFTNKTYTLSLTLTDQASTDSGKLIFNGHLDGTADAGSSKITNTFTGKITQQLVMGNNLYTVTINSYTPPGPPGEIQSGSIGAHATVTVQNIHILTLPEPGALVLAGLGGAACVLARSRRRPLRAAAH
jgi:hypothetical protein